MSIRLGTALLACTVVVLCPSVAAGALQHDDTLAAARELYVGAAYEEALAALDNLAGNPAATDRERATISHYRALCLLALNRPSDATAAIETMVRQEPLYSPPQDDLSPRTRQLFQDVQRRVLPSVAQQRYERAKAAYEEGNPQDAVPQFDRVIEILDAITAAGNAPPLMEDLRVLATGFRELSSAAARSPALPEPTRAEPVAGQSAARTDTALPVRQPIVVTPPVTLRQDVPPWPHDLPFPQLAVAVIEVVIGQDGKVQQARLQKALHPRYDQLLLAAARNWTYQPALRNGQPTAFVKAVRVELVQRR